MLCYEWRPRFNAVETKALNIAAQRDLSTSGCDWLLIRSGSA